MGHAVYLSNPKNLWNVANAYRATYCFGGTKFGWSEQRVPSPENWPEEYRPPRPFRMKHYREATEIWNGDKFTNMCDYTPVAVEILENSESLVDFVHPENAVYVFGPEDGTLGRGILSACHRFVSIPMVECCNLSHAVSIVLYDRQSKGLT